MTGNVYHFEIVDLYNGNTNLTNSFKLRIKNLVVGCYFKKILQIITYQ